MKQIPINVPFNVECKRIDDLLCCAFEGGSTYWCDRIHVPSWPEGAEYAHQVLTRGGSLIVHYDDESTTVNPDDLGPALEKMASDFPGHWKNFIEENEDADTGDVFFQILCFNTIVYG